MATLLVTFHGTFLVATLAATAITGIYLLLRNRTAASRIRVVVASSLCLLVIMTGFALASRRSSAAPAPSPSSGAVHIGAAAHTSPSPRLLPVSSRPLDAPRAVYGHSIVKGGIHTLGELLHVIATDPLAARHYKGFDITRARFIRLDHNIVAYVSYRVDGKGIYWTSKPELIMAGEEVITDGTNYIRVRCGNMISYAPQSPAETDAPTDTNTIVETFTPFSNPPLATNDGGPPSGNPGGGTPPSGDKPPACCSGGGFPPPPIFGGPPTTPPAPNIPGNSPPPPVVNADEFSEHGAFYALLSAIVGLILVRKLFS